VSVSTNQINVSCENQVINQCNCEHASLQSRRDLESSYPHTIFLVVRAGTFRITQMTLTPRGGVAEPIVFSNPDRSPERAAAELAIWKGGAVRVLVGGQPSRSIDHLRDLPAQVTLFDIGIREPRHGMVLKDRDLAIFARASQLQSFDLSHSNVSDAALLHLIGLKKLRTLDLRRTRISGKGLAHVARIEPLETLALDLTSIGDADLPVLYGLRHLRQLSLAGTNVSPEGRKELQRNMPQVKLEEIGVGTPLAGQAELPPEASPAQPQQASTQTPSRKLRCPATGHYYQRIDTAMSWHEAKQHCESLGGHLATITSAEENDFVYKNFAADHVCWLGATDEAEEGKWTWVTGEPFAFQNWFPGNPGDEEDCLVLGNSPDVVENGQRYFYRFGPQWNDHAAHGKYHGPAITYPLCEWDGEE
jgi:hypothetical protein